MKKIPTLFVRLFDENHNKTITTEVTKGMEWVLNGEGIATIKFDGSCCAVIDGIFYKRYDAKKGKPIPEGAIPCQENADEVTGHFPHWVKIDYLKKEDKWFANAIINTFQTLGMPCKLDENGTLKVSKSFDGTYEAIGEHFNSNAYGLDYDILVKHGIHPIVLDRSYEGIREYLAKHYIEGIVFWKNGTPQCKIKRSDFGFDWNKKIKIYEDIKI